MWELDKHIQKEEKIEYEGNPEWFGYFWWLLLALVTISSILIPALIIAYVAMRKTSTKYAITNKRVVGRYGIISEDFKSSTFKHITSVRVRQGIIGKIFRFGDISIDTSGSGNYADFVWRYVKDPIDVKNKIEEHIG